jgi:hypothetical protein
MTAYYLFYVLICYLRIVLCFTAVAAIGLVGLLPVH